MHFVDDDVLCSMKHELRLYKDKHFVKTYRHFVKGRTSTFRSAGSSFEQS